MGRRTSPHRGGGVVVVGELVAGSAHHRANQSSACCMACKHSLASAPVTVAAASLPAAAAPVAPAAAAAAAASVPSLLPPASCRPAGTAAGDCCCGWALGEGCCAAVVGLPPAPRRCRFPGLLNSASAPLGLRCGCILAVSTPYAPEAEAIASYSAAAGLQRCESIVVSDRRAMREFAHEEQQLLSGASGSHDPIMPFATGPHV